MKMECKKGYKEIDGKCVKKKENVFSLIKKGPKRNSSTSLKIFLGIALALIFFGLFNLGVATFYDSPNYSDYCDNGINGNKIEVGSVEYQTCNEDYENARNRYESNIFYIFVSSGVIFAVAGLFIGNLAFQIILLGAGVAFILEGILRNLDNKLPAFIAGVLAFGILSYFVWRKVK